MSNPPWVSSLLKVDMILSESGFQENRPLIISPGFTQLTGEGLVCYNMNEMNENFKYAGYYYYFGYRPERDRAY